jgi:hypothetical protein
MGASYEEAAELIAARLSEWCNASQRKPDLTIDVPKVGSSTPEP